MTPAWTTWRAATADALYGPRGVYRQPPGPAAHFRTSVHASPLFAAAIARLAHRFGLRAVVDLGSGRGELLHRLAAIDDDLALHGVDVVDRPPGLPERVTWGTRLPERIAGSLVIANEWLDDVPCDVVEVVDGSWCLVLVDPADGDERLGGSPSGPDRGWLARWWPETGEGDRAEVGRPRDEAWADVVRRLQGSVALAVDYGHVRAERVGGRYAGGTLAAYRVGRAVTPVPDGSCDVTAHVAVDACAAAGAAAGATRTRLTDQRTALADLGVDGCPPSPALAAADPAAYLHRLAAAGEAAELRARGGLGDFFWLAQGSGVPWPQDAAGWPVS